MTTISEALFIFFAIMLAVAVITRSKKLLENVFTGIFALAVIAMGILHASGFWPW